MKEMKEDAVESELVKKDQPKEQPKETPKTKKKESADKPKPKVTEPTKNDQPKEKTLVPFNLKKGLTVTHKDTDAYFTIKDIVLTKDGSVEVWIESFKLGEDRYQKIKDMTKVMSDIQEKMKILKTGRGYTLKGLMD